MYQMIWALTPHDISSGFPIKRNLNQSSQLQRLATNITSIKFRYGTFQNANNKGTDQYARMRGCAGSFVVRKPQRQFSISVIPPIMCMYVQVKAFYMHITSYSLFHVTA